MSETKFPFLCTAQYKEKFPKDITQWSGVTFQVAVGRAEPTEESEDPNGDLIIESHHFGPPNRLERTSGVSHGEEFTGKGDPWTVEEYVAQCEQELKLTLGIK